MSVITSIFNFLRFNRKNWKAVVLCIFAATIFWFFNALNKNYTTNISFPVSFDYNQDNYIPVRPLPEAVRVNVTGIGWNLFRKSVGLKVPPLVIPLERPTETKKIVGSTLPALFANQLEGFEINFVLTDTLRVALEPKSRRWVSLKLDSPSILFKKGYVMISEPQIKPDSVFLEGPWKLLNSLHEPVYLKLNERNIDDDFRSDVEVRFLNNELIKRDPPTVRVSFDVARLVVVEDSAKLELINMPKGASPFIEHALPCTFEIPEPEMKTYHKDSIRAVIDLKGFVKGRRKFLPDVVGLPPHSRVARVDSVTVKF